MYKAYSKEFANPRPRGRPLKRWKDQIVKDTGLNSREAEARARDRTAVGGSSWKARGQFLACVRMQKQPHIYRVQRNASFASRPSCLPDGPIGMTVNGVPIYSPYVTDRCYDAGLLYKAGGFDLCSGHVDPQSNYHYHVIPNCLLNQSQVPSAIIGVAFDGFPIYGPRTEDGTTLTSADLDECHGRLVDGRYRYHVTEDFPYFLGCFKGVVMDVKVKMADCKCYGPVNPCNPPQRNAYDVVIIDSSQTQREYRLQINGGRIACKLVENRNQSASPSPASARNCKISSAMSSVVMVTGLALGTMSLLQR
ncbi:Hypp4956 [Branchiostoma lanceolatum]|uniref:Hypp4956 protein n=1 Tax=Branchiostoma lanceolatum TaxID=7740 RepID=A0A8K0AHK3_BRALA|nr:Hypp4956 [Branchiostoma lanceolatum]